MVEPRARGVGVSAPLVPARRIYECAGFHCAREKPHRSFGHDVVGEPWEPNL